MIVLDFFRLAVAAVLLLMISLVGLIVVIVDWIAGLGMVGSQPVRLLGWLLMSLLARLKLAVDVIWLLLRRCVDRFLIE